MTNFIYDNTALSLPTADRFPVTDPTRQWGAADVAQVAAALGDIRTVIRTSINVKQFGAVGDGVTDDAPAIQAALNAAAVVSGGVYGSIVSMPRGLYLCGSQLSIPNGVGLRGAGPPSTLIKASNTFSATSLIRNASQDGTQEFAFLESLSVLGNKSGGALCTTAVVDFVSLFLNSYVRDVVIQDGSNVGLRIGAGGSPGGGGPVLIENVWCLNNTGHGFLGEEIAGNAGAFVGVCCVNLASEHQGTGKSAIYLKGIGGASQWNFFNTHVEQGVGGTGRTCVTIDGIGRVLFDGVQLLWGGSAGQTGITITNIAQNVEIQIRGVYNPNLINPVISDLKNSVTIGAINVPCYVTPETNVRGGLRFTPHTTGGSKSLVAQNSGGADVAWFDDLGVATGSAPSGSAFDIGASTADGASGRVLGLVNQARTRTFGFFYPDGTFIRFRSLTGGADVWDADNTGNMRVSNALTCLSTLRVNGNIGFNNTTPVAKPTITGSRGGNAALASLLTGLASTGLITDNTTA